MSHYKDPSTLMRINLKTHLFLNSAFCELSTSFLELIAVLNFSAEDSSEIYEIYSFLIDVILGVNKSIKFPNLYLVWALVIMYGGSSRADTVFRSVDGENIDKTIRKRYSADGKHFNRSHTGSPSSIYE